MNSLFFCLTESVANHQNNIQRDNFGGIPVLRSRTRMVKSKMKREVLIGWLGSLIEAYNMAIYSFMVPILLHFTGTRENFLLPYSLVFIGSCLFYPIGATFYGYIGDKRGRQKTCVHSTLWLGVATGIMGLIPFQNLGGEVWVFVLVCICAQHFFSGGEYHGSIVFSLEHSENKNRGLSSSLSCLFAVFGLVTANGFATLTLLKNSELWMRGCFLTGALGGVISYLLKKHCRETPAFTALPQQLLQENWLSFVRSNSIKIVKTALVMAFFIVSYSFIFIFLPLHFHSSPHHFDTFKSLIAYGVLLIAAGLIADRLGIQTTLFAGSLLFSLVVCPTCFFAKNLLTIQFILTACAALVIGPIHSWMLHQFKVHNRCQGIFISSGLAISIFGGSTVPICLLIFDQFHSITICSIYPLLIALGAFFCLITKKLKEASVTDSVTSSN